MKKKILLFSLALILLASLAPLTSQQLSQPPVELDTLRVGYTTSVPRRADPVRAYDSISMELITNVYDTLIAFNRERYWEFVPRLSTNVPTREEITKTITSLDINLSNPTSSNWSDGSRCIGWVDNHQTNDLDVSDILYMVESDSSYRTWFVQTIDAGPPVSVTLWRGHYIFHTRTSPAINFVNETGQNVDTFDVYDAEYSFERGLVQDQTSSPMWMFYEMLFDQKMYVNSDPFDSNVTEPTAMSLAHLIDDAVEVSGNDLIINVGSPFPDNAFKQILSQPWSSIVSKQFSLSIGCWNGDLYSDSDGDGYPDWWTTVRRVYRSPYDAVGTFRYVGTGPYSVALFDSVNHLVRLTRNPSYWQGWPALGAKSFVETVEIDYDVDWTTRPNAFEDCSLDVCAVPSRYMSSLLDVNGEPLLPQIKSIKNLVSLLGEAMFFNFKIDSASSFIGSGQFPDGISTDFFNNTHVRKAFAYAFNHSEYLEQQYSGEALVPSTPLISGLYPDYRTGIAGYDVSFDLAEVELKAAFFDGNSVWETGFTVYIPYYWVMGITFEEDLAVALVLQKFFAALSTYDGRPSEWPDFNVETAAYDPSWTDLDELPTWRTGWLADFSDADNFLSVFMHSNGNFAYWQSYSEANGWGKRKDELLNLAVKTVDDSERAALYAELEQIYIDDCPSVMLAQPLSRKWLKYWVKGWYYNPLLPTNYYCVWKQDTCWADVVTDATVLLPDGKVDMKDIGMIVKAFGSVPGTSRWGNGSYGAGCFDVYSDRKVDMKDIGVVCSHFGHMNQP